MTSSEHEPTVLNLVDQRQQRQEVLEHVLDLLEKAEERSAEEPENETKWRKILNHLWKSLDEAKARLNETEAMLEREQRKATTPTSPTPEPVAAPTSEAPKPSEVLTPASKVAAAASIGRTFHERRRRILFRCAIDKVKDRRISAMTLEELDLAIEFFRTLHERQNENKENERLADFLTKTNINAEEVCAEMRRHRAQLYARKNR